MTATVDVHRLRPDELDAVIDALTHDVGDLGLADDTAWLPAGDPHRR